MFRQKFFNAPVEIEIVLRPLEAVTFVGINDVRYVPFCFSQSSDHRVGVGNGHPRIVFALTNQQRRADRIDMIER